MLEALLITTASIVLGAGLGVLTRRKQASFAALRTFAVAAVAAAVAVQMLPEALQEMGGSALLVFLAALVLPGLVSPLARRLGRADSSKHALSTELGFLGFLAHQVAEGVALGSFSTVEHAHHGHEGLVLGVAAHTVPLTALLIAEALTHRSARVAAGRAVALALATGLGFVLAGTLHEVLPHELHSWLSAGVAGFLVHIIFHDHGDEGPRSSTRRVLDLVAMGLGVGLPLLAAGLGDHPSAVHAELGDAFVELAWETAPMLLLGLAIGALLQVAGARIPSRFFTGGNALRQALRGIAVGAPLPLCACGVLPIAESLRKRGAGPALVMAFLVATPELGPETLTLTLRFMGGPFAGIRIAAALALALFAGLLFAWVVGKDARAAAALEPKDETGAHAPVGPLWRRAMSHFDELLLHVAPWAFVGLLAAAYVQVALPSGSLADLRVGGADLWLVAIVAMPAYVCAASATPIAAVLLVKGISPGAVLVGLLLGPATNIATVGVLRRAYGTRVVVVGVLGVFFACVGLGYLVNAADVPIVLPEHLVAEHGHGWWSTAAVSLLLFALVAQLWRWGTGPWFEILGGQHDHDHGHGHGHGHDHDHDHDHDDGHGHHHE